MVVMTKIAMEIASEDPKMTWSQRIGWRANFVEDTAIRFSVLRSCAALWHCSWKRKVAQQAGGCEVLLKLVNIRELNGMQSDAMRRFNILDFVVEEERLRGSDAKLIAGIDVDLWIGLGNAEFT